MLMLMSHCRSLVVYAYAYAYVASEDQALDCAILWDEILQSASLEK